MNSQLTDIDAYTSSLDGLFSKLVRDFNKIQLADHTKDTIKMGTDFLVSGSKMLSSLKMHVRSIETLLSDCSDFVDEITEDLSQPKKEDEFVYHTKNGMLSFPGRDFIIKKITEKTVPIPEREPISEPTTQAVNPTPQQIRTLLPELGYYLKVPVVNDVSQIPPAIYYVKSQQPGLFIRLPNNNIVRIPFPEVVDSKKEYDRKHSIRCKYRTKLECDTQRSKMAKYHNSQLRVCNFAHAGDSIVKIGYPSRCPAVPNFGNPQTMAADIKYITQDDVKNMLMYGLNDLLASIIWFDYSNISKTTFEDLNTA